MGVVGRCSRCGHGEAFGVDVMSRLGMRDWTQGEIARLLDMRAEGKLTYTEMGMELGFTRNAIAAKLRRLEKPEETQRYYEERQAKKPPEERRKLKRKAPEKPHKPKVAKEAKSKPKERHSTKAAYQIVLAAKTEFKHKPVELDEYERSRLPGAPLIDVCGCRYPLTDSMPHMFCDAPRQIGKSYCSYHMAKTNPTRAGTNSEKSAIKAAEWLVKNDLAGYVAV